MSTSAAVEIRAGSKSETSWAMGKLSVWSAANGSGEGAGLLFGLQATAARIAAISQAGARIGGRLTGAAGRAGSPAGVGLDLESPQFPFSRRSSAWLEQRSFKPMVQGSNPCAGTIDFVFKTRRLNSPTRWGVAALTADLTASQLARASASQATRSARSQAASGRT